MKTIVLQQLHDHAGHLGAHRTTENVKERFYWPGYESDIEKWVRECQLCQKRKPPQPVPQAPLGTIKANHPLEKITWDIMRPLPASSKGMKYNLVVTDIFSKWVEAFPIRTTDKETLATILVDEIVCQYDVPSILHSGRGANLTSKVISALCERLGIRCTQTTAYHPQGNGQVERFNRTLEAMLSKMVKENQKDWDLHIPKALFAYRMSLHESTGFSPFCVNFGRSPSLPVDIMVGRVPLSNEEEEKEIPAFVEEVSHSLKGVCDDIRQRLNEPHQRNKARYGKKNAGKNFSVGDRVWLYVPAIKQGRTKKLSSLWRGPYTILDKIGSVTYRVQLIGSAKTLVVHKNRLKICYGEPMSRTPRSTQKGSTPTRHKGRQMYPTTPSPRVYSSLSQNHPMLTWSQEDREPAQQLDTLLP